MKEKVGGYWSNSEQEKIGKFLMQSKLGEVFTQFQLDKLESLFSQKLPQRFKDFLTTYAGLSTGIGYIDDPIGFFIIKTSENDSRVKFSNGFGGINGYNEMMDLYTKLRSDSLHYEAGPRIPEMMLPINSHDDVDILLLDISKENYGKIWYWESIEETWGSEENNTLGFVANSFVEFIDGLDTLDVIDNKL